MPEGRGASPPSDPSNAKIHFVKEVIVEEVRKLGVGTCDRAEGAFKAAAPFLHLEQWIKSSPRPPHYVVPKKGNLEKVE